MVANLNLIGTFSSILACLFYRKIEHYVFSLSLVKGCWTLNYHINSINHQSQVDVIYQETYYHVSKIILATKIQVKFQHPKTMISLFQKMFFCFFKSFHINIEYTKRVYMLILRTDFLKLKSKIKALPM